MSVFKKQGVYWIDYYVHGRRKRERIGRDRRLPRGGETEALVRFRGLNFHGWSGFMTTRLVDQSIR
jgi:hypothetical protein